MSLIQENLCRNFGICDEQLWDPDWRNTLNEYFGDWGFDVWDLLPPVVEQIITTPAPYVPDVIGEIPQTWEELEELDPELFEPILETRPGLPPDPYPEDLYEFDEPTDEQEDEMAHDWGHLIREGIGSFFPGDASPVSTGQPIGLVPGGPMITPPAGGWPATAPAGCDGMQWSGAAPPKGYKVVNYCGQGVLRKIRRRRRPRMLSRGDAQDVATIVGLVGKGQMAAALINRR